MHRLIEYVTKLLKVKRVSRTVIMVTGLLAAVIIFITIYATQVGNFIIRVNTNEYKLYLCENENFEKPESLLHAKSVSGMVDTTLSRINIPALKEMDGSNNTSTYLAYTCYLQNQSELTIDYNIRLGINAVYRNVDRAAWIYISETRGWNSDNRIETEKIYAKKQTQGDNIGKPESPPEVNFREISEEKGLNLDFDETTPFLSNLTVFDYNVKDMKHLEIVKYTFIIWLEGWDADTVNDKFGSSIRMEVQYNAFR